MTPRSEYTVREVGRLAGLTEAQVGAYARAGLLGIKSHIVDTLQHPGGQCAELYPDKPIYDIPALSVFGAQELVERLLQQVAPMAPVFHLGEQVAELQQQDDARFFLRTSAGTEFLAKTVVIAAGLGSFQPAASA